MIIYVKKQVAYRIFFPVYKCMHNKLFISNKILNNPVEINIAISKPPEQIVQKAFIVYEQQKAGIIKDMLGSKRFSKVIVFCSKKQNVKELTAILKSARLAAEEIHSDLDQKSREQYLQDYRNGKTNILVATDILSISVFISENKLPLTIACGNWVSVFNLFIVLWFFGLNKVGVG